MLSNQSVFVGLRGANADEEVAAEAAPGGAGARRSKWMKRGAQPGAAGLGAAGLQAPRRAPGVHCGRGS